MHIFVKVHQGLVRQKSKAFKAALFTAFHGADVPLAEL